jgi:hypothetical protein
MSGIPHRYGFLHTRVGTQSLLVDLSMTDPDPKFFQVPAGFAVQKLTAQRRRQPGSIQSGESRSSFQLKYFANRRYTPFVIHSSPYLSHIMTPEEKARLKELVDQIQIEKDQNKFLELVAELNDLLDSKEKRLNQKGID